MLRASGWWCFRHFSYIAAVWFSNYKLKLDGEYTFNFNFGLVN